MAQNGIQMQPTNGRPASPTKRRPDGKEGLLTQKPPPLDNHGRRRGLSGLWERFSYIPGVSIVGLILLLVGIIMHGQEGRTAANSTNDLFRAALGSNYGSDPMVARAMHAYHAAYVSAVVIGVFVLVFTIVIQACRLFQHLKTVGGRGSSSRATYITLEGLAHALGIIIYIYCAYIVVWFAINMLILAAVYIGHYISHFADTGFASTLKPLLTNWLTNANTSYQALNDLLASVPVIGSAATAQTFTNTAFASLVPTPSAIASYLNSKTGNKFSYLINQVLGSTPGVCSNACIDLSQYPFMGTNACICNSPAVGQIAIAAGQALHHYIISLVGLFILYLGASLLLARISAEASKTRYDRGLLFSNKHDRLLPGRSQGHQAGMGQHNNVGQPHGTVNGNSSMYA